jgi:hypothetical protein
MIMNEFKSTNEELMQFHKATSGQYIQLLPVPPSTPITTIGATAENVGHYTVAILKQPNLTLPAKYVLAATETITTGDILKTWSKVTGKPALYLQTSIDDYDRLWPKWGLEVGLMIKFWEYSGKKSWDIDGLLTAKELGIESRLIGLESVFKSLDWSKL